MAADATQNTLCHFRQGGDRLEVASGGSIVADSGSSVTLSGNVTINGAATIQSTSPTIPLGYGTGAGGSATQTTNRSTSITLNTVCGKITTDTTSLAAAAEAEFKVANSAVAAIDVVAVSITPGGTGTPFAYCSGVAAGAFSITLTNLHAATADTSADVINFVVIKGASA